MRRLFFVLTPNSGEGWKQIIDEVGNTYGRLEVMGFSHTQVRVSPKGRKTQRAVWDCRCTCGARCKAVGNALRTGNKKSCGCLQRERAAQIGMRTVMLPETRAKLRVAMLGRHHTPETKKKLSEIMKEIRRKEKANG